MRQQPARSTTYRLRAEARINATWPGGIEGFLRDYRAGKALLADLTQATGVAFRAIGRILDHNGLARRTQSDAYTIAHKLHPERAEATAEKLRITTSARRPEVRKKMSAVKRAEYAANPLSHPNAIVSMSKHEAAFSRILKQHDLVFTFNAHADRFWLDFSIPELQCGFELERNASKPVRARHDAICDALNIPTIFYLPTRLMIHHPDWVSDLVARFKAASIDPAALREYSVIRRHTQRRHEFIERDGYKFVRTFM